MYMAARAGASDAGSPAELELSSEPQAAAPATARQSAGRTRKRRNGGRIRVVNLAASPLAGFRPTHPPTAYHPVFIGGFAAEDGLEGTRSGRRCAIGVAWGGRVGSLADCG